VSPPWARQTYVCGTPRTRSAADYRATKERRASARRGWRKRICKGDTAKVRETAAGVPANVVAIAVAQPRGVTPPALVLHECVSAGDLRFPLHARYPSTGG
jgi:hypothetical protein